MAVIEISSLDGPGAGLYYHLTDRQLLSRQQPDHGIVIAEGPKVVLSALEAGLEPVSLLMRRKFIDGLGAAIIARCGDIPVYTAEDEVLSALTGFRLQRAWVLCALRRPKPRAAEEIVRSARRVAVLEGITEPSNVGAIFRSAAALGTDAILLTPSCSDPWHRRAVRVCMGAVFRLPWARMETAEMMALLKANGFRVLGMALREPCLALDDPALSGAERTAVCLGTEDTGLTGDVLNACDAVVKIPMAPGIDSLNVAAAAAVAFWQLRPGHPARP